MSEFAQHGGESDGGGAEGRVTGDCGSHLAERPDPTASTIAWKRGPMKTTRDTPTASTTAAVTARILDEARLRGPRSDSGRLTLLATDGAKRFARVGGRFLGEDLDISDVELVDI